MKKRVYIILFFIIIAIFSRNPISQAVNELEITPVLNVAEFDPDSWNPGGGYKINEKVASKAGKILGFIRSLGIVASLICLMIIGLKTMIGSIEEKTQYKESLPGYLIGVFLLFASTTIPSIIYDFLN